MLHQGPCMCIWFCNCYTFIYCFNFPKRGRPKAQRGEVRNGDNKEKKKLHSLAGGFLFGFGFSSAWDKPSHRPGWLPTCYGAETGLRLLTLLTLPPKACTTMYPLCWGLGSVPLRLGKHFASWVAFYRVLSIFMGTCVHLCTFRVWVPMEARIERQILSNWVTDSCKHLM